MLGDERVAGTIIALLFEMMKVLGMRLKGKRRVLNQRSRMWSPSSIRSRNFDWYPGTDIRIE